MAQRYTHPVATRECRNSVTYRLRRHASSIAQADGLRRTNMPSDWPNFSTMCNALQVSNFITCPNLARLLNRHPSTVYRQIQRGDLKPTTYVGSVALFSADDAARIVAAQLEDDRDQDDQEHAGYCDAHDPEVDPLTAGELLGRQRVDRAGPSRRLTCDPPAGAPSVALRGFGRDERTDSGGPPPGAGLRDAESLAPNANGPGLGSHSEPDGPGLDAFTESESHDGIVVTRAAASEGGR